MRRLILQTGVSIDGYVAALDGSHPWNDGSEDAAVKRWILDSVWAAGAPRETVWCETPASFATSVIAGRRRALDRGGNVLTRPR